MARRLLHEFVVRGRLLAESSLVPVTAIPRRTQVGDQIELRGDRHLPIALLHARMPVDAPIKLAAERGSHDRQDRDQHSNPQFDHWMRSLLSSALTIVAALTRLRQFPAITIP